MKRLFIALVAMIALAGGLAAPAAIATPDFNVGDRVEIDPLKIGKWEGGVVIAEDAYSYLVRADPLRPGMPSGEYTIPKTPEWLQYIRASTKPLPDDQKVDNRKPTGILDCPIEDGISSSKLSIPKAKQLVRCSLEYYEGDDYASRMDIKVFKVGKPRKWNPYNDIGPGTIDTVVYPIKVTAVQLWWTTSSVREQRWQRIYDCYYSTLDEWKCGLSERIKDWPSVTRPRG
jgi:hypothetical protein